MVLPVCTRRSRLARVKGPSDNSASGSEVKRCSCCLRASRITKETIHNGLQLLRVRYGLPYVELPDCDPSGLSRFLSFLLLQGKVRPSVAFPRRQRPGRVDFSGLCSLQRLCRRERWELAHSVSSIKRNLPPGCRRHTPSVRSSWEEGVLSQLPPPSDEYLAHVKRVATRLFSPGWDRSYNSFVGSFLPNPSARLPRFSRADHLWAGRRSEFLTLTTSETDLEPVLKARYKEVQSAGKRRPLLIFDEEVDLLGPLHKTLFSHLQRFDWLLCGPPTEKRMASVCVNRVQTSVDLIAATDGLHPSVGKALLSSAFFTSVKVPRSIRRLAYASLSPRFRGEDGEWREVRHGQMMGAYLSFPLLCLHSYCAATFAARECEGARFLVNGDDCVISAERAITVQDYPEGYRLNDDKTIRAEGVVEVNSTAFLRSRGRWREVRHLRRGGAPVDYPGMLHMASAVSQRPLWVDAYQRARIGRRWGFLPSQLGHTTYVAWKRERQMRQRRYFTALPEAPLPESSASLVQVRGRDPDVVEAEALRSHLWVHGREGGLKRDVFSPSCGKIRRSYGYRARPCWSYLSFVGPSKQKFVRLLRKRADWGFLLPEWFQSKEEEEGLAELDLWRHALGSLACE